MQVAYRTGRYRARRRTVHVPALEIERVREYGAFADSFGIELPAAVAGRDDGKEIYVSRFIIPPMERVIVVDVLRPNHVPEHFRVYRDGRFVLSSEPLSRMRVEAAGSPHNCTYTPGLYAGKLTDGEEFLGFFHNHPPDGSNSQVPYGPSDIDIYHALDAVLEKHKDYFLAIISNGSEVRLFGFSRTDANPYNRPYKLGSRRLNVRAIPLIFQIGEHEDLWDYLELKKVPINS